MEGGLEWRPYTNDQVQISNPHMSPFPSNLGNVSLHSLPISWNQEKIAQHGSVRQHPKHLLKSSLMEGHQPQLESQDILESLPPVWRKGIEEFLKKPTDILVWESFLFYLGSWPKTSPMFSMFSFNSFYVTLDPFSYLMRQTPDLFYFLFNENFLLLIKEKI